MTFLQLCASKRASSSVGESGEAGLGDKEMFTFWVRIFIAFLFLEDVFLELMKWTYCRLLSFCILKRRRETEACAKGLEKLESSPPAYFS
ncbi:Hypothetical protein Minf_1362 [Methylacidiphilum infernorum V4]|uniref:Uncharacterized protein n=1 Tax=Methylacidiphilum infernorum (isolate V4) TaxID=481448 RepID=B3DVR3_METI4|nr:Hypothetical protein Minf_1362 [Methylacidiphilum infernorum V4]